MKYRSYNQEAKIATALVENVFNNIVISRMDCNGNVQKTIDVPLVYGARPRVLKELENPKKNLKPPVLTIVKEDLQRDDSRINSAYDYKKGMPDGYNRLSAMRAIPINIRFTLSGIAVYEDDIDQIVSNFVVFFKPDIFISWKHPKDNMLEIKSQLVWGGSVDLQYPVEVNVDDHEFYQFETSFTFKTWFFPGFMGGQSDDGDVPLIEKVNYSADSNFFNVGDAGYGMSGIYAVPKSVGFDEFTSMINDGLVGNGVRSGFEYPRIVRNVDGDMNLCYPVFTERQAATLKITLLESNRDDPDYSGTMFRFNSDSKKGDCSIWHVGASMSHEVSNGIHEYAAEASTSDDFINFTVRSTVNSASELRNHPSYIPRSSPYNIRSTYSDEWMVSCDGGNGVVNVFNDDGSEFTAPPMTSVTWKNLDGNSLNVRRISVSSGADPTSAPTAMTVEGLCEDGRWILVRKVSFGSWSSMETKTFSYDDWNGYRALRVTFGASESGGDVSVRFMEFSSSSEYFSSNSASYYMKLSVVGDDESSIELSRSVDGDVVGDTVSTMSGGMSECDACDIWIPSMDVLTPARMVPQHYLTFWYRGRKYGLSIEGGYSSETARTQTITYGNTLPYRPVDGSVHTLTSCGGSQMYQYDFRNDTWFAIGNQTRGTLQKIGWQSYDGSELNIEDGGTVDIDFEQTFLEVTDVEVSFEVMNAGGWRNVKVSCGGSESVVRISPGSSFGRFSARMKCYGKVNSVSMQLVGDGGPSMTIRNAEIGGLFSEGDFGNDPETTSLDEVKSFLINNGDT